MFFLGWGTPWLYLSHNGGETDLQAVNTSLHMLCIYEIHRWSLLQAYIISAAAMMRYSSLQFSTTPVRHIVSLHIVLPQHPCEGGPERRLSSTFSCLVCPSVGQALLPFMLSSLTPFALPYPSTL
jgi:hypothetical protein